MFTLRKGELFDAVTNTVHDRFGIRKNDLRYPEPATQYTKVDEIWITLAEAPLGLDQAGVLAAAVEGANEKIKAKELTHRLRAVGTGCMQREQA
jgi:hypothetical protein